MATETQIANKALARINVPHILSIDGTDKVSQAVNRTWDLVRDEVLREGGWNFSIKRRTLAQKTETPDHGYNYYYPLPDDFIALREFKEIPVSVGGGYNFEIESADDGTVCIVTNETEVKIVYTARITDTSKFDPLFVEALSLRLAAELCSTLTGSRQQYQALLQEYEFALGRAKLADARDARGNKGKVEGFVNGSELVQSRYDGRAGSYNPADVVGLDT